MVKNLTSTVAEKHVTMIKTSSGQVGVLASGVPVEALEGLLKKLTRRRARIPKVSKRNTYG